MKEMQAYYEARLQVAQAEDLLQERREAVTTALTKLYHRVGAVLFPGCIMGDLKDAGEDFFRLGYLSLYGQTVIHIPMQVLASEVLFADWLAEQRWAKERQRLLDIEKANQRSEGRSRIFRGIVA